METNLKPLPPEKFDILVDRSSEIQTRYIVDMIKLCDDLSVDRDVFLKLAAEKLKEYIDETSFYKMDVSKS